MKNWLLILLTVINGLVLFPAQVRADDFASLDALFAVYERTVYQFVVAMEKREWPSADKINQSLLNQAGKLKEIGQKQNNPTWVFYSSNLFHHAQELSDTIVKQDGVEAIYLISTLLAHIGQIQSSHPLWLRHHIWQQYDLMEQGIAQKNKEVVRNTAEVIHTSANKIILSLSSSPEVYRHTYWKRGIIVINQLGDAIIGEVNAGNWSEVSQKAQRIRNALEKWSDSFQNAYPRGEM